LLVLAAGAAAASALWLVWRGRAREEPRAPLGSAAAPPATAPRPAATATPPAASVEPLVRAPESLRPPPRSAAVKPAPGMGLQLQAIGERDGKPVAILSNRLVHEGDAFDGVTVVRIGADEVEIEVRGRRRVLRF
jgi:hypothetical protein